MRIGYNTNSINTVNPVARQKTAGMVTAFVRLMLLCSITMLNNPVFAAVSAADLRDPMEYFFHQSFNNLDEELEVATGEHKSGVLIMFVEKDCPWCLKMKTTIMNRAVVQDYYREHFRLLTVDVNGDAMMTDFDGNEMAEKDFANRHRVRATPVFIFFDTSGKQTMRFTGITRDVTEFIWLAEYVVSGEYRKTNFTKYKQNRKQQEKVVSLIQSR